VTELWLDGLATRDFEGTLRSFLGAEAPLLAATITRTNRRLMADFTKWSKKRLDDVELVYTLADGVYLGAGPGDERRVSLSCLAPIALASSIWSRYASQLVRVKRLARPLSDLAQRGFRARHLLVADGAFGLWAAADKAWPKVAQQRCCLHKMRNVEEKLPERLRAGAHKALSEIVHAEHEPEARRKLEVLAKSYSAKYPKVATCLRDECDRLFSYYRFPHETWLHIRTTNTIESIFAPIRTRTEAMKRLRTAEFATAVTHALILKLAPSWRRLRGYCELADLNNEAIASRRAA